jgi:hypothetical protein
MEILSGQIRHIKFSTMAHAELDEITNEKRHSDSLYLTKTNRNEIHSGTRFHSSAKIRNFHYDLGSKFLENAETCVLTTQSL